MIFTEEIIKKLISLIIIMLITKILDQHLFSFRIFDIPSCVSSTANLFTDLLCMNYYFYLCI